MIPARPVRVLIALNEELPPHQTGGSQKAALEVAHALVAGGDEAVLAGRLRPHTSGNWPSILRAVGRGRAFAEDRLLGLPTYRLFLRRRSFPALLRRVRPDVVLLHAMAAASLAIIAEAEGVPVVMSWHDVEFDKLDGSPTSLRARHVANSRFTAGRLAAEFGIGALVIPPIFSPLPRAADETGVPRDRVLFVNPVKEKGVDVALEVARHCPDITFEFLESWVVSRQTQRELAAELAALPNVILTPHQAAMAPVYARARFVIAPSRWQEAWGRVASEAQACGLPVIATRIGGLPEAVGAGGVLLNPDAPVCAWADAVRELWSDRARYAALADAARRHAERPGVDPLVNAARLRAVLAEAAAAGGSRRPSAGA